MTGRQGVELLSHIHLGDWCSRGLIGDGGRWRCTRRRSDRSSGRSVCVRNSVLADTQFLEDAAKKAHFVSPDFLAAAVDSTAYLGPDLPGR